MNHPEGFPVIGIPGIVSNLWTYGLHGGQLQPLVDGVKDEFQPVGNPNLVVDGAKMVLYGLLGDG